MIETTALRLLVLELRYGPFDCLVRFLMKKVGKSIDDARRPAKRLGQIELTQPSCPS